MSSTAKRIFSGVFWTALQTIINRSFGFVIKLFLARILFPEDYGLVGMATVFIAFITVFNDLGMGAALVQRKKEDLNEKHYHTAFWTGVVFSAIIYLIVSIGVGEFAAWFYDEPLLKKLIPVLGLGILASPINIVHRAQLNRDLNFKKLALINNSSSIFSGILALILAYFGAGVWSLVFNSISSFVVAMPLYFWATGWKPKLIWEKSAFKDIFSFGVYTTGTGLFNKLISQIDYILVGKFIGASALGFYSFAYILTNTFRSQITGIMSKVMYPIYASLQDDPDSMKHYFLQVIKFNAFIIYPIMTYFILFGEDFIPVFFGDKWQESILVLKILSGSVLVHLLVNSNTDLIRAYGKPKLELKMQLIKSIVFFVPLIVLGTYYYGIIGTAIGYSVAKILSVLYASFILNKLFQISFGTLLEAVRKPFIASVLATGFVFLGFYYHLNWVIKSILFITFYTLFIILFGKRDIKVLIGLLKNKRSKTGIN